MLLQEIPGPPDTVEGRDKATTPTQGRCPTSSKYLTKGRWAPAVSSSLLLSWPSPSCPGHGYLVIIWGDISVQAGAGAGGAGKFPGKALYCDPITPLSNNTYGILARRSNHKLFIGCFYYSTLFKDLCQD